MTLSVKGIFLFSCVDAHVREIAFLLNKMIVLCLMGSDISVLPCGVHTILDNDYVKLWIPWAKFKPSSTGQRGALILLCIVISLLVR